MSDEAIRKRVMDAATRVQNGEPTHDLGDFTQYLSEEEKDEALAETEGADRYADMINAPLSPKTIAAIAKRIKSGDLPTRTIKPRKDANDDA